MKNIKRIYSVSGEGEYSAKQWWVFIFARQVEKQKWSPLHYERTVTRCVTVGRWSVGISRRTKHFQDAGWRAE